MYFRSLQSWLKCSETKHIMSLQVDVFLLDIYLLLVLLHVPKRLPVVSYPRSFGTQAIQFGTCLKDSQKAVLLCKKENHALPEHACQTNYTIGRDNSDIITTNSRYHQHLCLKAWYFNLTHVPLNHDYGDLYLKSIYTSLKRKGC